MPENLEKYAAMRCTVTQDHREQFAQATTIQLPPLLKQIYGSNLTFSHDPERGDRPVTYLNFVIGMDGVFNRKDSPGGGPISQGNQTDAFCMALLRASADAIMVGAGTLNGEPNHEWTTDFIFDHFPQMKDREELRATFKNWRRELMKNEEHPPTFFMTNSGKIDFKAAVFKNAAIRKYVVTGAAGARAIRTSGVNLRIIQTEVLIYGNDTLDEAEMMRALKQDLHIDLLLHEGGHGVANALVQKGLVHQLFLTRMAHEIGSDSTLDKSQFQYLFGEPGKTAPTGAALISERVDGAGKAHLLSYALDGVKSL